MARAKTPATRAGSLAFQNPGAECHAELDGDRETRCAFDVDALDTGEARGFIALRRISSPRSHASVSSGQRARDPAFALREQHLLE